MASGGNNISDINNDPPQEAYVLYGAVVGGPDKYDRYFDIRGDWPETEVRWSWLAAVSNVHLLSSLPWIITPLC
jgi:hypothetical protein